MNVEWRITRLSSFVVRNSSSNGCSWDEDVDADFGAGALLAGFVVLVFGFAPAAFLGGTGALDQKNSCLSISGLYMSS